MTSAILVGPVPDHRPRPVRLTGRLLAAGPEPMLPLQPPPRRCLPVPDQPDPVVRRFAVGLLCALVEVWQGRRRTELLGAWTTPAVLEAVRGTRPPLGGAVRLRSVRLQQHDTAVEVWARVESGPRSAAVAAQLRHEDAGWRCTALEFRPCGRGTP